MHLDDYLNSFSPRIRSNRRGYSETPTKGNTMKRDATKEIIKGAIGIAIAISSHYLIKKAKIDERVDAYFDAKEADQDF